MPSFTLPCAVILAAVTTLVSAQIMNPTVINFNGDTTKAVAINTISKLENGTPVQLSFAVDGQASQRWTLNRGPTKVKLNSSSDPEYCLDAGANPQNGTLMKVWQCYDNLPAQAWYYTGDNRIALEGQGFCLDLPNANATDGQTLQIWACTTGNTNQIWTVPTAVPSPAPSA
ncbi:ricin B lectin domain-containing protein [Ephemerocybe angulata]|uniref:Ricin B lectin domain-containing protein n=2 Tax=Ephemerocybe angulata TaxID=980116 RepID=A0A8H6HE34_9AGAR|nr:ricin B lectin domain-containing protein [Tulosesus angulatus]